jgi:monofunctional glycosyltransferase
LLCAHRNLSFGIPTINITTRNCKANYRLAATRIEHSHPKIVSPRGASTITQQLVKNLFFGTGRSILRKGAEFTLPVAEFVLGKQRILEIYLNVVEWGPGIYGAESACRYYDETAARNIGRQQAARLAAILPAPLKRRPERMNNYSAIILKRMGQMGW